MTKTNVENDAPLLAKRGYRGYLIAVFLNAFNDNAFKVLVGLSLMRGVTADRGGTLLAIVSALFILPFLLFAAWSGSLADRYSKRSVFVVMSAYELFAMALAAVAFAVGDLALVGAALFWTGAQSAFYSPAKYGLLPESLLACQLSRANGHVEAVTFAAIVMGTAFGGFVLPWTGGRPAFASLACGGVALAGWIASRRVAPVPAADPQARVAWLNPLGDTGRILMAARRTPRIASAMIGLAFFWFLGAAVQMNVLLLARHVLFKGLSDATIESSTGILLAVLSLGIGAGSLAAGRLSGDRVRLGFVISGALGTAAMLAALGVAASSPLAAGATLAALGFAAGFFAVPLQTVIQLDAPPARRGAYLAASNFVVFSGILASSAVLPACEMLGGGPREIFAALAALTVAFVMALAVWAPEYRGQC